MNKSVFSSAVACIIYSIGLCQSVSQESVDAGKLIQNKNFTFVAQSVIPQRGGIRQLSTTYDLTVANDSLISNLPYFGRAFSAPMNSSQNGFVFTETNFEYSVKSRKKKGWDIDIKPKGTQDVRQMSLTVFDNGSASLRVTSNNREPIAFNGFVRARAQ